MANERLPLEEMTLRQLRRVASECGISRYSRMRKSQLLIAIQEVRQRQILSTMSLREGAEGAKTAKFELGQAVDSQRELVEVDRDLGELPASYGESRIVLMPRDPQWAYAYWEVSESHKQSVRNQGGQQLALRLCDVTDLDQVSRLPHSVQEYLCDEQAREWYLPIAVSDRDYRVEIGYRCADGRWLVLARSTPVRVPPIYPSDWVDDHFITVPWEENLRGKTFAKLEPPEDTNLSVYNPLYDKVFKLGQGMDVQRVLGSLSHMSSYGLSSYIFPAGTGGWAGATPGYWLERGETSLEALDSDSLTKPWLMADAELVVYGTTEPNATVMIDGQPIKVNPDGTFRFQMAFRDGYLDYPIAAVAANGEEVAFIHMQFTRDTIAGQTVMNQENRVQQAV